eukprot:gene7690-10461_t
MKLDHQINNNENINNVEESNIKKRKVDYNVEILHGDGVVSSIPHHNGNYQNYFANKIAKLRVLHKSDYIKSSVISNIFKDCIIFINGLTEIPTPEIRRLVTIHGGECVAYQMVKITHFVCNNLTDAQLKQIYSKVRVNKPAYCHVTVKWILDSIKAKKRLHETNYLPDGTRCRFGAKIDNYFNIKEEQKIVSGNINTSIHKSPKNDMTMNIKEKNNTSEIIVIDDDNDDEFNQS